MRRRDLNQLTGREREVLALLRRDFTNEQMAQHLTISLDGAKYHVSRILSKLGVETREEAAAVAVSERRRWWGQWRLWAKIAGAATTAIAVAAAVVLLIETATSSPPEEQSTPDTAQLTVEEAYERILQAVRRPSFVFHTTLDREPVDSDERAPQSPGVFSRDELWIDGIHASLRFHDRIGFRFILAGDGVYRSGGFSEASPSETWEAISAGNPGFCPRSTDPTLGFLLCGGLDITEPPNAGYPVRLDAQAEFGGRPAVALAFEMEQQVSTGSGEQSAGPATPTRTPTCRVEEPVAPKWITRIFVDAEEFLPLARVNEYWDGGTFCGKHVAEYHNDFLKAEGLPTDWFDPRSIGYQVGSAGPR